MQTIRFLCLLLLLGSIAHQVNQRPGSEPSNSTPRSVEQSDISSSFSKEGSQAPRTTVQTSRGQVHQNQSSNPKASANASLDDHLDLQANPSRSTQTDVKSTVVEDLQLLGQACLEYRKSRGGISAFFSCSKDHENDCPKAPFRYSAWVSFHIYTPSLSRLIHSEGRTFCSSPSRHAKVFY